MDAIFELYEEILAFHQSTSVDLVECKRLRRRTRDAVNKLSDRERLFPKVEDLFRLLVDIQTRIREQKSADSQEPLTISTIRCS